MKKKDIILIAGILVVTLLSFIFIYKPFEKTGKNEGEDVTDNVVIVRVDKNIVGTSEVECFFEDMLPAVPLLPTGQHILEVKYDEFLPDYIKQILNEVHLTKTAFSKYYYARKNQNIYG